MLKFKIFLEKTCVTKKLAYIRSMNNEQTHTKMDWKKSESGTYLHTETHYYSVFKSCSSWYLLQRNKETLKGMQSRYRTKRDAMEQAESYALGGGLF